MKKAFRLPLFVMLILLLVCFVIVPSSLTASAECIDENPTQEPYYEDLFSRLLSSDGAPSEPISFELAEAFRKDPYDFLSALVQQPDDVIDQIAPLVVGWTPPSEFDTLKAALSEMETYPQFSEPIELMAQQVSQREQAQSTMTAAPMFDDDDFAFDAQAIKHFIDLHIELGRPQYDQEFEELMALRYSESPKLFSKIMTGYSNEDISYVSNCIAKGFTYKAQQLPEISSVPSDPAVAQTLTLMQSKISSYYYEQNSPVSAVPLSNQNTVEKASANPGAEIMSTCAPSIGSMYYSNDVIKVGEIQTLTFNLTETKYVSTLRTWRFDVMLCQGHDQLERLVLYTANGANMVGVSGAIVNECSNRSEIMIHGGRPNVSTTSDPWYPLYPTNGCVRVSNSSQLELQSRISGLTNDCHLETGRVEVREI